MEVWMEIKGYDGLYAISNFGRIKGLKRTIVFSDNRIRNYKEKILKPLKMKSDYMVIGLSKNNKKKHMLVHRLVAIAFLENPESKETVNHIDGNKQNNHVDNLEWCTCSENALHKHYVLRKCIKPVNQYDLNGNIIKSHKSTHDAWRRTGINQGNISSACNGRLKTAGGYIWKYAS